MKVWLVSYTDGSLAGAFSTLNKAEHFMAQTMHPSSNPPVEVEIDVPVNPDAREIWEKFLADHGPK